MKRARGRSIACVLLCLVAHWCAYAYPPALTVRWVDWQQQAQFAVESPAYSCRVDTGPARIAELSIGGVDWFADAGLSWRAVDKTGVVYQVAPADITPRWDTWQKQSYQPAKSSRARMNVWSAGPYYWDAHLLDIPMLSPVKSDPPLRGEVEFHAHRDQLRIQFRADAKLPIKLDRFELIVNDLQVELVTVGSRIALVKSGANGKSAILLPVGGKYDEQQGVISLPADRATVVCRPLSSQQSLDDAFLDDLRPLDAQSFELTDAIFNGYDSASGLYVLSTTQRPDAFTFEESFRNPSRRIESRITLKNDSSARQILMKTQTGVGNLEAAMVADPSGFPLPIPAQVSKNFAGEKEEPDDTAFGDSYVPLTLNPTEAKSFQLFHLTQNWGACPLKQVSSVRFFHIYWHLSTGASETTCFSMNWMEAGFRGAFEPTIFHIPDYRPMTGPMWPGQPQHHCAQFPGFLQYNDGKARLVYDYTTFDSISPLLARFTMHFHTSDDAAKVTLRIMEAPQADEMRTFIHMRYDWNKPVRIEGDARENLRLVNIFEHLTPSQILWTDPAGKTTAADVRRDKSLGLLGTPLSKNAPVVGSHRSDPPVGDDEFESLLLLRSYTAKLEGQPIERAALSARFNEKVGSYWLTTEKPSLALQPGDFVEADILLMPHGEPAPLWLKPERERSRFALVGQPRVEKVSLGKKLSDFPAAVMADNNAAAFQISGGADRMPVIIEGFSAARVPLLWSDGLWQDEQLQGGDYYQIEPGDSGKSRIIFSRRLRDGQTHNLQITAVSSQSGIARLSSEQGRLVTESAGTGTISLEAPVVFGPAENRFDARRLLFKIDSSQKVLREIPAKVSSPHVNVTACDSSGVTMSVDAPATIVAQRGWVVVKGDQTATQMKFNSATHSIRLIPGEVKDEP